MQRRQGVRSTLTEPARLCEGLRGATVSESTFLSRRFLRFVRFVLMSGGGDIDRSSDKRFDLFISFPGSQSLSDLGFSGPGLDGTVRALVAKIYNRLSDFPRHPSVFYDEREIEGHWPDYLSRAVLQLRGGGVALVLLTADFLSRKYCLAELRAFLELERLRTVPGRESEAVEIRVVVLDLHHRAVPDALQGAAVKDFIGSKLREIQCKRLTVETRSTGAQVVKEICGRVEKYWHERRGMCLGGEIGVCVDYLARFFSESACHPVARALGLRNDDFREGMTVPSIFSKALMLGRFSDSFYLDALSSAAADVDAKAALEAFRRKWNSDAWIWSLDPEKNDVCLPRFFREAGEALSSRSRSRRAEPDGPDVKAGFGSFRPYYHPPSQLDSALVRDGSIILSPLRAAVCPSTVRGDGSNGAHFGSSLGRLALISINGESGVGKTSSCKLLCADEEVRAYFADGAVLWVDVGQDAKEEKIVEELRKAV